MNIKTSLKNILPDASYRKLAEEWEYIRYYYYKAQPVSKRPQILKKWFQKNVGYELDLDHPQTFNAKIQWLKLYDATPVKTMLSDKEAVRAYISEKIGEEYLIPILGVWDSLDDIDFSVFPDKFVLKTNHGSGFNMIIKDKTKFDQKKASRQFKKWLHINYAFFSGYEMHYEQIKPRIIAEQYMENDGELLDYKFVCFHGEVKYVWVDWGRYSIHKRNIYDCEWKLQDYSLGYTNDTNVINKQPKNLKKMIELAEILSKDFCHARVDFYEINDKIYFGEITFTSGSGLDRFCPVEIDQMWGEQMILPFEKNERNL